MDINISLSLFFFAEELQFKPIYMQCTMIKKLFPEPTKFKPERFCVNGKIGNTENVMPFGCGELFFNKAKTDCN